MDHRTATVPMSMRGSTISLLNCFVEAVHMDLSKTQHELFGFGHCLWVSLTLSRMVSNDAEQLGRALGYEGPGFAFARTIWIESLCTSRVCLHFRWQAGVGVIITELSLSG